MSRGGEIHMPVHLGGIGPGSAHKAALLLVKALAQHLHRPPQQALVKGVHHPGLHLGQQLNPPPGGLAVHLLLHFGRGSPLLRRVREDARPLQARLLNKGAQLLKLRLALARQTADEGGAHHQLGQRAAQPVQQRQNLRLGTPAVHGLEQLVADVLYGNIQIFQNFRLPRNGMDQPVVHLVGVEIVQPNPVEIQLAQLLQQVGKAALAI
ncbi:hypothetical protein SDC9_103203 [bioreactor metagenome]|uniref:Uncharacterized protein n=1 Tax=bioreactor metagenome TaxID=1076179 RepID=A0A645AVQ8_9ZZZZ